MDTDTVDLSGQETTHDSDDVLEDINFLFKDSLDKPTIRCWNEAEICEIIHDNHETVELVSLDGTIRGRKPGQYTTTINRCLLARLSPYFKALLEGGFSESTKKSLPFDSYGDELQEFEKWVSTGVVSSEGKWPACDKVFLYVFADYYDIPALRLDIMTSMVESRHRVSSVLIAIALEYLPPSSPMYKYLVENYVQHVYRPYRDPYHEDFTKEFLYDIFYSLANKSPDKPCRCCHNPCDFHDHDDEEHWTHAMSSEAPSSPDSAQPNELQSSSPTILCWKRETVSRIVSDFPETVKVRASHPSPRDECVFGINKALLIRFSPYYRAVFLGGFADGNQEIYNMEILPEDMIAFRSWLYDGELTLNDDPDEYRQLIRLYIFADYYDFPALRRAIMSLLKAVSHSFRKLHRSTDGSSGHGLNIYKMSRNMGLTRSIYGTRCQTTFAISSLTTGNPLAAGEDAPVAIFLATTMNTKVRKSGEERAILSTSTCQSHIRTPIPSSIRKVESDQEEFPINKGLLCQFSAYFRALLHGGFAESTQKSLDIDLQPSDMRVFTVWLSSGWLYSWNDCHFHVPLNSVLVRLYTFADYYDIPALRRAIMLRFASPYEWERSYIRVSEWQLGNCLAELPTNSPFYRWLVEHWAHCNSARLGRKMRQNEDIPQELRDLVYDRTKDGFGSRPCKCCNNPCDFHEHESEEEWKTTCYFLNKRVRKPDPSTYRKPSEWP
ncbi:hypothetical protein KCU65_g8749, partial [Aureobasidium melanogenum]